jgi:pyruvate-formate lyase-activating enzyme
MSKHIFYGNGQYLKVRLESLLMSNIIPVCIVDADKKKQNNVIGYEGKKSIEILSLDMAMRKYPDAKILITVSPNKFQSIYDFLICNGVPRQRILDKAIERFLDAFIINEPQHCRFLGQTIFLDGWNISTCCCSPANMTVISYSGDVKKDVQEYYRVFKDLKNRLNEGKYTSCTGCHMLVPGASYKDLKIEEVNISTGLPGGRNCNHNCVYCNYCGVRRNNFDDYCEKANNVFELLVKLNELGEIKRIVYGAGEITISQYRNEILEYWKKENLKGSLFSNASIYIEEIYELLSLKQLSLHTSLDAGTTETFKKIHGVNCFDDVVRNLEKYSKSKGNIFLRYIVLEGLNCNEKDVNGFVNIAKKLNAKVTISRDNMCSLNSLSNNERYAIKQLKERCSFLDIPYGYSDFFEEAR